LVKNPKTYGKRKFFVAVCWNIILQRCGAKIAMTLDQPFGIAPSFTHNRRNGAAMRVRP
jgi:hypothetical protein